MPEITIRRATDDDVPAALAVASAALAWAPDEPHEAFFRWKHVDNVFGPSPMWVACADEQVVGFRTMLRWRFVSRDGEVRPAVRAVDTATDPDHRRLGIFRQLTLTAVEQLCADGSSFVFNTPNAASRSGYLSMGWQIAGRVGIQFSAASGRGLGRAMRARAAAEKWSEPAVIGDSVDDLADDLATTVTATAAAAVTRRREPGWLETDRSAPFFRWRYGFEPLHYRVVHNDSAAVIVRRRRRGAATEGVIAETVGADPAGVRALVREIRRRARVDYVLMTTATAPRSTAIVPLPRTGPVLTVRDLADSAPTLPELGLSLGDLELF